MQGETQVGVRVSVRGNFEGGPTIGLPVRGLEEAGPLFFYIFYIFYMVSYGFHMEDLVWCEREFGG